MTPNHTATPPANPLAAKAGRLFVVTCSCMGSSRYMDGAGYHQLKPEDARKFSTVPDAECWIDELAASQIRPRSVFSVVAYDDPASTDAWLAEMRQGAKDAERVKWVAGERVNGHAEVGAK